MIYVSTATVAIEDTIILAVYKYTRRGEHEKSQLQLNEAPMRFIGSYDERWIPH